MVEIVSFEMTVKSVKSGTQGVPNANVDGRHFSCLKSTLCQLGKHADQQQQSFSTETAD